MKRTLKKLLYKKHPVFLSKYFFYKTFKRKLNLKNPSTFNEKLMWLKLNEDDSIKAKCADKYLVRDYINQLGYSDLLVKLYKVYDTVEEIDFEELPSSFVMKCTHGCGFNIICLDKDKLDKEDTIQKLKEWMKTDYGNKMAELHYSKIKPRIIVERFLGDTVNGKVPSDYMIHCFHGVPQVIEVGENYGNNKKYITFNCSWDVLDFYKNSIEKSEEIKRPKRIEEMLEISRALSKEFTYVRVDLYFSDNEIYFGELTFTPGACLENDFINDADYQMGQLLDLKILKKESLSKMSMSARPVKIK
ncbi:ATP-grasp fold amidoligase family protein [Solibacillus sp. CAU 1738]|uniref:ATP-grasp fold amidoligase family protein n=1 Tax=Solibacillus sp. CAU 1738 TaxID=3140363 RepID=UPI003261ABF6